jgi:hypothetical protein
MIQKLEEMFPESREQLANGNQPAKSRPEFALQC